MLYRALTINAMVTKEEVWADYMAGKYARTSCWKKNMAVQQWKCEDIVSTKI